MNTLRMMSLGLLLVGCAATAQPVSSQAKGLVPRDAQDVQWRAAAESNRNEVSYRTRRDGGDPTVNVWGLQTGNWKPCLTSSSAIAERAQIRKYAGGDELVTVIDDWSRPPSEGGGLREVHTTIVVESFTPGALAQKVRDLGLTCNALPLQAVAAPLP